MLTTLYNQTLSLDSRLTSLQQKWTGDELPPAIYPAISKAINNEVRH